MCICRLCSCINYHVVCAKSGLIISGCVVIYAKCICVYVASVSISAGCGVFIVRLCIYAKSLYVYILVCNCINWVTFVKLCVCVCVCVCQVYSCMC